MENKFSSQNLDELISLAEAKSKRGDQKFWFLSSVWTILLIIITVVFIVVLTKMERLRDDNFKLTTQLDTLKIQLNKQSLEIESRKKVTENLENLFNEAYLRVLQNLGEEEKVQKAQDIAQKQLSRSYITSSEAKFLTEETRKSGELPGYGNYYFNGLAALQLNNYDEAIEQLTISINLKPDYIKSYFVRGRAYQSIGEYKKAETDFSIYLDQSPDSPDVLAARAFSYLKMSQFNQSINDCLQALSMDSSYWLPYHYLGFSYYKVNDYQKALTNWKKAATLRIGLEEKASSLENMGLVYLSQGQWASEIQHALEVNSLFERSSWNWFFLYIAASESGQRALAQKAQKKWKELKDTDEDNTLKFYLPRSLHKYFN